MSNINPNNLHSPKPNKVFLIWKTVKKTKFADETKEKEIVEIHSDIDKAWDRHIELNKKYKSHVSFSVEVQEVKE